METTTIEREPTQAEQKDFVNLADKKKNVHKILEEETCKKDQECIKARIPFCMHCVRIYFDDKIKSFKEESLRSNNVSSDAFKLNLKDVELFAGFKNFDYKDKHERWIPQTINGTKVNKHMHNSYNFVCKKRGCGVTINVPVEECSEFEKKLR